MNRYEFEILAYIAERQNISYDWRELINSIAISGSLIDQAMDRLIQKGYLKNQNQIIHVTEDGLMALEPYRVKKAIIFAAGMGSRMNPITLTTPKPLVKVHGIRIIDRLLDALYNKGIDDIVIVRGYLKEKFSELLDKYPRLHFIDNDSYLSENNISSALKIKGEISNGTYICAGDLFLSNPDIIKKYHYCSNYLASYALSTDDWCFDMEDGYAVNYRKGGQRCFNQYEITYWTADDCKKLQSDWSAAYNTDNGHDLFWEFIPLVLFKEHYNVEIRICRNEDILEIDSLHELAKIDDKYMAFEEKNESI